MNKMKKSTFVLAALALIATTVKAQMPGVDSVNIAQQVAQMSRAKVLVSGDKFTCLPSMPQAGVVVADIQLLTCLVAEDVKSKFSQNPAIQKSTKLIGSVQGQKVTWSSIVTVDGLSVQLDAKAGDVMMSQVEGATIPDTLTVHVMRNLVFN
jgi:3-isopropylmalate dehydratase small subunit